MYQTFFRIPPRSRTISLSDCTRTVKLLPRPISHLNKSLTRLKSNLFWNTIVKFEREYWQRIKYFFCIPPSWKTKSLSDSTRTKTLLPRPISHLNKSLTRLKSNLFWNTIVKFERENWQRIKYFFRIPPSWKTKSLSDSTRTKTLLPRPISHLNKSLTTLKSNLCWSTI